MNIGNNPTETYGVAVKTWPEGLYQFTGIGGFQSRVIRTGSEVIYSNNHNHFQWKRNPGFITVSGGWEYVGSL